MHINNLHTKKEKTSQIHTYKNIFIQPHKPKYKHTPEYTYKYTKRHQHINIPINKQMYIPSDTHHTQPHTQKHTNTNTQTQTETY